MSEIPDKMQKEMREALLPFVGKAVQKECEALTGVVVRAAALGVTTIHIAVVSDKENPRKSGLVICIGGDVDKDILCGIAKYASAARQDAFPHIKDSDLYSFGSDDDTPPLSKDD